MTSRPPHIRAAREIPNVPEGTVLRLTGDDWSHCAARPPGAYIDMTVSRVHRACTREIGGEWWVWIVGHHHPACTGAYVERHPPCLQLMVRVEALAKAVRS